jgi:PAS domain S-box-containing protein
VYAIDTSGTITYISPRAEAYTGFTPEEIAGRNFIEFIHPDDRELQLSRFAEQLTGGEFTDEFRVVDKDGKVLWVRSSGRSIEERGVVVGMRGVLTDITAEKRSEDEDLRVAKLESLSVLAGGIAHDFNNILTSVIANLSVAADEVAAGESVAESIVEARSAAAMAQALTRQLLTFSKGGDPVKKVLSIGDLLRERIQLMLTGSRSSIDLQVPESLWPVEMDPSQIGQAIDNLVINADQAMPDGGMIRVSAGNSFFDGSDHGRRTSVPPGRYVWIEVADQGSGIPAHALSKIFDPYFTTKLDGSGLGLATTHSVVTRHGGRIRVRSEPGQETVFTIHLPAAEDDVALETPRKSNPSLGSGRILVMDDDRLLLKSAVRVLRRLGYQVQTAVDGDTALAEYEAAAAVGKPFDLVILDIVIPGGMGGGETIARLREIDPDIRAIVSSGYSTDPIMANYKDYGFGGVVAKPYDLGELGRAVREVLETD